MRTASGSVSLGISPNSPAASTYLRNRNSDSNTMHVARMPVAAPARAAIDTRNRDTHRIQARIATVKTTGIATRPAKMTPATNPSNVPSAKRPNRLPANAVPNQTQGQKPASLGGDGWPSSTSTRRGSSVQHGDPPTTGAFAMHAAWTRRLNCPLPTGRPLLPLRSRTAR